MLHSCFPQSVNIGRHHQSNSFPAVVDYGINVLRDAMRDLLDPWLRGGGGSYSVKKRKKDAAQMT
jgi:hypothetical protein